MAINFCLHCMCISFCAHNHHHANDIRNHKDMNFSSRVKKHAVREDHILCRSKTHQCYSHQTWMSKFTTVQMRKKTAVILHTDCVYNIRNCCPVLFIAHQGGKPWLKISVGFIFNPNQQWSVQTLPAENLTYFLFAATWEGVCISANNTA